ncbi:MAG: tRNA (guanosine(37)-N1)-methyltransferase TrmD [Anaerolineae bacterium]
MRFDIFSLFPEEFVGPFQESIIKRAQETGLVQIVIHDIRAYATDRQRTADDTPYGGGGGMVLKPEPIFRAVEDVLRDVASQTPIVLLTPQGRRFTQQVAHELSTEDRLALICGHYEGVDERVRQYLATDEISIGDYVLTGGELPAMVIVDAVTRLLPGVLGDPSAAEADSFATGLLEHPHYTRPYDFRGWTVPDVLLSGHHGDVERWRRQEALRRTWERRPDLLESAELTEEDMMFLDQLRSQAS